MSRKAVVNGNVKNFAEKEKNMYKTLIRLALHSLERRPVPEGVLDGVQSQIGSIDQTYKTYNEVVEIVSYCTRSSVSMEPDTNTLKEDFKDKSFPDVFFELLVSMLQEHSKYSVQHPAKSLSFHPKLDKFRWRINIAISSSKLSRILEPHILFEMTSDDGQKKVFEVSVPKFHLVRYNVTTLLKEIEVIEKKKLLQSIH